MRRNNLAAAVFAVGVVMTAPAYAQDATAGSSAESAAETSATTPAPIAGKAVLVMDDTLLNMTLKQHPASYTGALTTVTVPMGEKLRDDGVAALKARFSDGAEQGAAQDGAYNIALRLDGFSYKYDSLSTFGMAVTPRVTITVTADITGPNGLTLHKAYNRADLTAGHYVASFKPAQKVLNSLDKALGEIFNEMADDVAAAATSSAPTDTTADGGMSASSSSEMSSSDAASSDSASSSAAPAQP
jgi:hypothetical protein